MLQLVFNQTSNTSLRLTIVRYNIGGSPYINLLNGSTPLDSGLGLWKGNPSLQTNRMRWNFSLDNPQVTVLLESKKLGANVFQAYSNSRMMHSF